MLSAFLGQEIRVLKKIKVAHIRRNPNQPRRTFDQAALEELAQSIGQFGILNPLTVRKVDGGYELIAGERRLRAARLAGLREVPCIVLSTDEQGSSLLALIENLQRRDLDCFEEALGYRRLMERYGLTQEEAAAKVGKTQSAVANKLRLLRLPTDIIEQVRSAGLTERHARALLRLEDPAAQRRALDQIIAQQMNVAKAEAYIESLLRRQNQPHRGVMLRYVRDVRLFINTIDKAVTTMRQSGVEAQVERQEEGEEVRLTIVIPRGKTQVG